MIHFVDLDRLLGGPKEDVQAMFRNNPITQIQLLGRTLYPSSNADAYYKLLDLLLGELGCSFDLVANAIIPHLPSSTRLIYRSLDDIPAESSRRRAKAVAGGYAHTNENAEVTVAKICALGYVCDENVSFEFTRPLDGSPAVSQTPKQPVTKPKPAPNQKPAPVKAAGPIAVPQRRPNALILGRGISCWKKKDMQGAFVQEEGVYELVQEAGGYTLYRGENATLKAPAIVPVCITGKDGQPIGDAGVVLASNSHGLMGVFDLEGRMLVPCWFRSIQPETKKYSPRDASFRLKAVNFEGIKRELKCSWFFPKEGGAPFSGFHGLGLFRIGMGVSMSDAPAYLNCVKNGFTGGFWNDPVCLRDNRLIGFHYGHTEAYQESKNFYYNLYCVQDGRPTFLNIGSRGGIESLAMVETQGDTWVIWKDNDYLCYSVKAGKTAVVNDGTKTLTDRAGNTYSLKQLLGH